MNQDPKSDVVLGSSVKLYGLHRSGTNLMQHLLQTNFRTSVMVNSYQDDPSNKECWCQVDDEKKVPVPAWKHGQPPLNTKTMAPYQCPHLVMVRHPLSWLVSFHKWHIQHGGPSQFTDWLREPRAGAQHPMRWWETMTRMWILLCACTGPSLVVKYEEILDLESQRSVLEDIRDHMHFSVRGEDVQPTLEFVRPDQELRERENQTAEQRAEYEKNKEYLSAYSADDLQFVHNKLPNDLCQILEYEDV